MSGRTARRRVLTVAGITTLAITAVIIIALRSSPEIVSVAGYGLDDNPSAAVQFSGKSLIVVGTVDAHGQARVANEATSMRMIFTPARLTITEVLQGDASVGTELMVRGIGGRVGETVLSVREMPSIRDLAVGTRVLLFLGDARDIGDGLVARTPDFDYVVDDEDVAHGLDPGVAASVDEFRRPVSGRE